MYDVIIIGAGPAGLTAAIYAERASKEVLIFEALNYGGQIINAADVDNYPGEESINGYDLATKMYNQAIKMGAEIKFEKVVKVEDGETKKVITEKGEYEAKTIIIATGNDTRKLGLENESELIGKGVSYCATCDGTFYKDKIVAIVGGGNTALEDALYLSDIAKKVYLIHRRDSFRGDDLSVKKLSKKDNVEFIYNSNVTNLIYDDVLKGIEVTNNDGNKKEILVDGLFIAVGRIPENEHLRNMIDMTESGYILASEDCKTNIPGIFVAGDAREKTLRQLVTATSDGAVAAIEAIKYINNKN